MKEKEKSVGAFDEDISQSLNALRKGEIILYPTDTIWGIGCDATNAEAVRKIFSIKGRPENQSLIVLVDRPEMILRFVKEVPEIAWDIIEIVDKPLTVIYPVGVGLAEGVTAPDKSIAIRLVNDEFCKRLIHKLGKPLVSTSANLSGKPSPQTFKQIDDELIKQVDYVVKWRQNDHQLSQPSGIIKLGPGGEVKVIRN